MKRILLAVIVLMLVLPAVRQAEAGVDVSIDFFYDNVGSDGSWVEVADYGYCWQPSVAVSNSRWRPYSDGYWAYTDVGWTWVSYEDFGWATYHYGRWTRLRDRGWFWVPGREWGPAWVSWRTGGNYVGWAPLPPRGGGEDYDNRPINGQVDVEYDIGPAYYNFVDVRYIGEPVLRERIVETNLNVNYISETVNVTNITYTNSTVYNYGPDYDTLSRYSTRPIRRMTLERDANVDLSAAVRSKGLTRVEGDKLVVAAPPMLQKPAKLVAPKTVKEKIAKPAFERGWDIVPDPKTQADLKQKMKSEDPKNVPPPSVKPRDNAEAAQSPATASPAVPASGTKPGMAPSPAAAAAPAGPASPAAMTPDRGKGKDKRLMNVSPMPTAAAPVNPASSPATTSPEKPKKERFAKPMPALSPSSSNMPGTTPAPMPNKPKDRRQDSQSSLATSPDGTPVREAPIRDKEARKDKRTEKAPDTMPPTRQPNEPLTEKATRKPKNEPPPAPPNRQTPSDIQPKRPLPPERVAPPSREAPPEAPRKHPLPPERTAPPAPGPGANAPAKPEAPHKRGPDKKTTEPAPSPGT
jgi:hypothetical protein